MMKKMRTLMICLMLLGALSLAACTSGGDQTTTAAEAKTTAAPPETTATPPETTAATPETTAAPVETTAAPVETTTAPPETTTVPVETTTEEDNISDSGVIELIAAKVELAEGWYLDGSPSDKEVKLKNDNVGGSFLSYVKIKCTSIYSDQNAKYWAEATQGNFGGKGTIEEVNYNGINYYLLSGFTDDNRQTYLFTDSGDYWVQVSIYLMDFEAGEPMLDHITLK